MKRFPYRKRFFYLYLCTQIEFNSKLNINIYRYFLVGKLV